MSAIPTREGYDFLGLFDAEVGGTQYVNSQGASLAPFIDNKNLVLFPQFKAKEYRLVLNYQGAPVTGEREIVVSFGSRIQSLPMDLTLENKTFMGWWTEPDRKGLQVADEYGVLPEASLISSRNFDLTDPDGFIYDKHTPWCQIDFLSPPPNAMRGAPCALFACLGSRSRTPKVRSLILALKRTQHGVPVKYRSKLCARGHFMGFHRIPSLRLGNQIGSIFCRFTPPKPADTAGFFVERTALRGAERRALRAEPVTVTLNAPPDADKSALRYLFLWNRASPVVPTKKSTV